MNADVVQVAPLHKHVGMFIIRLTVRVAYADFSIFSSKGVSKGFSAARETRARCRRRCCHLLAAELQAPRRKTWEAYVNKIEDCRVTCRSILYSHVSKYREEGLRGELVKWERETYIEDDDSVLSPTNPSLTVLAVCDVIE